MNHPPGSNGFYLSGTFEGSIPPATNGWRRRLMRHFDDGMSASEQAIFDGAHWYACHAVNKFSIRREFCSTEFDGADSRILEHEKPLYYVQDPCSDYGRVASLATFSGPVVTVDDALRSFIEWLEPEVHTFVPIEVRTSPESAPIGTRNIMVVEGRFDSFTEVRSHPGSFEITPDRRRVSHKTKASAMRQLALRKEIFGDAHLWIEPRFSSYLLCMSDRLQAEIADAGLRIPRHWPMKEV